MPRHKRLAAAIAEIEDWIDEGKPTEEIGLVVLPPDTVDELSDEENIANDLTEYGAANVTINECSGYMETELKSEMNESPPRPQAPLTRNVAFAPADPVPELPRTRGRVSKPVHSAPEAPRTRGKPPTPADPAPEPPRTRGSRAATPARPTPEAPRTRGRTPTPADPAPEAPRTRGRAATPARPAPGAPRTRGTTATPAPKPRWRKRDTYTEPLSASEPDPLYRSHPELIDMSPFETFKLFLNDNVINLIVTESNKYANRDQNNLNFKLDEASLLRFLGALYLSGYHSLPQEPLYWSKDDDVGVRIVRKALTKTEFHQIKRYIHVADNQTLNTADKMAKIRPLIDALNEALLQFGVFSGCLSADEQMVPYFGHHGCKMTIRMKPIRFGFKKWVIAGSNGYPFMVDPYTGKSDAVQSATPLGSRVVNKLITVIPETDTEKHVLFIDNLFTSIPLLDTLREQGLRCTGTVRSNRIGDCPLLDERTTKQKPRGFYDYSSNGSVRKPKL